jgi:hypothetical protein
MRRGKTIIVDLRKVGLSRESWRGLRLEARALGVPMEIVAELAIAEFIRRKRQRKA